MGHHRAVRLGFRDAVSEAFVDREPHWNSLVLESLVELERVGNGNARVELAVLDEGRRLGLLDVRDVKRTRRSS